MPTLLSMMLTLAFVAEPASHANASARGSASTSNAAIPLGRTIRHTIRAGEPLAELLDRYGVSREELERLNPELDAAQEPKPGTLLVIEPRLFPAPRQRRKLRVRESQTWDRLASRLPVTASDLRKWNIRYAKRRRVPRGATIYFFEESTINPRVPSPDEVTPAPPVVRPGAFSWGHPGRGKLVHGVALPDRPELYTIRFARLAYGSSLTVENIQRALALFRARSGFTAEIKIGAISRRTGRRLRPHRSHQSGRDVDVRLPAMPGSEEEWDLSAHQIDWYATWLLVASFVDTEVVDMIFLERKFWGRLRHAARRLGATDERIADVMDKVRHSPGHDSHIHVRFGCNPGARRCREH